MNNSTKILSFSSPKGGVGRTMTLTNCAKIYSEGISWAGIESSITLLVDFDFHAPGIHYYDFLGDDKSKQYDIFDKSFSSFPLLQLELNQNKVGIAFLFSKIVNSNAYLRKCEQTIKLMETNSGKALSDFQEYVLNQLLVEEEYNPIKHLIQLKTKSLFILPAGSPNHPNYNDTVFNFDWLHFIKNHLGLYLIDCIIYKLIEYIKSLEGYTLKPVRILLDQQAGISISAALNRSLADSHILVGGFNEQNKAGLKALVDNYFETYKSEPWIVLNQYNLRNLPFEYVFDNPDESPHDRFKKADKKERVNFIEALTNQHSSLTDKIFVTEFVGEAVQKEHFHSNQKTSIQELIKLLVSVEKSFEEPPKVETQEPTTAKIIFIGERIEFNNIYSGPLNAVYQLLNKHYCNSQIVALAATHEDIVSLITNGEMKVSLSKTGITLSKVNIQDLTSGIYNMSENSDSETTIKIQDLDFIAYPYYVFQSLFDNQYVLKLTEEKFVRKNSVVDSLKGTSSEYYKKNIFRWNEYAINEIDKSIIGVPLFFNFQLLVYRRDYFNSRTNLADEFRHIFHRQFRGFNDPDDLLKFADLTNRNSEDGFKSVMLCGNPNNIAMWYEWQTIFSVFYYKNHSQIPRISTYSDYIEFILSEVALDATLMYLKLRKWTDTSNIMPDSYDWDELVRNFYLLKESSLIFIWPDAIPINDRMNSNFIYQVPPSFHVFEESWLLSIIKKVEPNTTTEEKIGFLNKYLTPEYQADYVSNGGLPVHKDILSSLDFWRDYPFLPALWSVYENPSSNEILNKRDCFSDLFKIGKSISSILDKACKNIDVFEPNEELILKQLKKIISDNIYQQ